MSLLAHLQEVFPNRLSRLDRQIGIVQGDVNSRLEGRIHVRDPVRRQEQNPLVVLQHAQEDTDELVTLEVVRGTRLEEDVTFVKEEDCVPFRYHLEDIG